LPEELVFYVNYLGGNMVTFALNFSRPDAQVILQYYSFRRIGFQAFSPFSNISGCRDVPRGQARHPRILRADQRDDELPVFAFTRSVTTTSLTSSTWRDGWVSVARSFPPTTLPSTERT